jgi:hypothetical protein
VSNLGRRFLAGIALLLGFATLVLTVLLVGRWLVPEVFGPLPPWLPEDTLMGLGYQLGDDVLQWLPALVFSAVLLTFSYWLKPEDLPTREHEALVRFSVLAIVTSSLFAVSALLAQPWLDARLDDLAFRHNQATHLEDEYLRLKAIPTSDETSEDLDARLSLIKRLGLLRPNQSQESSHERFDYDFELQILKARFELDEFFRLRLAKGNETIPDDASATVEDLLHRAEAALADTTADKEFQANLWGYQAYRRLINALAQRRPVAGKDMDRAKAVVDQSWQRIYARTLAADERLKASYFFRKGKSLGDFQFQNYLEAFYGFQELHRDNPGDQEVARYKDLALEKVAGKVLFQEDMNVLFAVPAAENLVFLNRESPVEVVRIGKLLDTSQGVYIKDFEFLRLDAQGKVALHWVAPYGHWGDNGIDFRVWQKANPVPRFPQVLSETPGNEYNPQAEVDPPAFVPRVTVRDLEVVSANQPRPQTIGTWDLLVHGQAIAGLGYNPGVFQTEFLVRLGTPFGFFLAFVAAFALAWRSRVVEAGRSWWIVVPILPLIAQFVVQTLVWLARLAVGSLLYAVGLETSATILAVGFVVLAAAGVVVVQRNFHKSLK